MFMFFLYAVLLLGGGYIAIRIINYLWNDAVREDKKEQAKKKINDMESDAELYNEVKDIDTKKAKEHKDFIYDFNNN